MVINYVYGVILPERVGTDTDYKQLLTENSPHLCFGGEVGFLWEVVCDGPSGYQLLALENEWIDDNMTPFGIPVKTLKDRKLSTKERENLKDVLEYVGCTYQTPRWYMIFPNASLFVIVASGR